MLGDEIDCTQGMTYQIILAHYVINCVESYEQPGITLSTVVMTLTLQDSI